MREKQQWVLCDGLSNAYMPHDSSRFFNAADVKKMANTNSFRGKYVFTFKNGIVRKANYDSLDHWHNYYNRNNAHLEYIHPGINDKPTKWNYLKQFYSFSRNFDLYSDANTNNWLKIVTKMFVFYLMAVIVVVYLIMKTRHYLLKHK